MLPVRPISQTLAALFSESVGNSTICKFIHQLSGDYSHTETLLLRGILRSPFIHVDETKISIQGRNWYVWVLTDGKHVVFRLTDSRETTLIHKLLERVRRRAGVRFLRRLRLHAVQAAEMLSPPDP